MQGLHTLKVAHAQIIDIAPSLKYSFIEDTHSIALR